MMAHECNHEEDLGAMKKSISHMEKVIDGNGQEGLRTTVPILCKSVTDLTVTVGELRTAVSGLNRFYESYEATQKQKNRGFTNTLKVIGTIIAFVAVILTVIGMNKQTEERVKDIVDQYGYDTYTRGFELTRDSI